MIKTRYWDNIDGGSTTAVQFRDDTEPMVFLHSNIGWLPLGNTPKDATGAEAFAKQLADGYGLTEASQEVAQYMLGEDDESASSP